MTEHNVNYANIMGIDYARDVPHLNDPDPLAFPSDLMTGIAGDFARLYSHHLESPPQFFFFSFLTCLGSIISDRVTLECELKPQPRLYVLILGQSADDRKSTAIGKTIEFFRSVVPNFAICSGLGSAEGLSNVISKHTRVLVCLDEFKSFVSKCGIDSSVLLPCFTSLFEMNSYENNTKKGRFIIENGFISLLAASTIETYQRTWSPDFMNIGFNNRLFLVVGSATRRFPFPQMIPAEQKTTLHLRLRTLLDTIDTRKVLPITQDALDAYSEWYQNIEPSIHTRRLDTYALRLMTLLAVNDSKWTIDQETVAKSIHLCNWQLLVRQLNDPINADNKIAKIEETIRRHTKKGPKSERDLKRAAHVEYEGLHYYKYAKDNLLREGEIIYKDGFYSFKG
jgi:hypothetical protein